MKGKWIWLNRKIEQDAYAEFVGEFVYEGDTFIELSANTEYALYINDKFVYSGQYADFPWYKVYDRIDVTKYTKIGKNTLSIRVWYQGDYNFCHYVSNPCLCFDVITNNKVVISSSNETKSRVLPFFVTGNKKLITQQIGYSFKIDYTIPLHDFSFSKELDINCNLTLRGCKLLKYMPKKVAKKISTNIYDLGEETVGLFYMVLNSNRKEETLVAFSEHFDIEGNVPRIISTRDFSFEIISCGEQRVFNPFRKLGCRYFQVYSNANILEIGLIPCEYPFELKNNSLKLNSLEEKIYNTSIRTLKLNAFEHYYDCPWREQGFYSLDSRFQMRYGYIAFNNNEYQHTALKLMSEDRNSTGMVSITVPTSCTLIIPSFSLFYIVSMQEYAESTNDISLIETYFIKMQNVLNVFINNMQDGLVQNFLGKDYWNFYEWNPTLDNVSYQVDSVLNFTFLLAVKSMLKICEKLNKKEEYDYYNNLYVVVANRINEEFYSTENGLYYTTRDVAFSELINAYAILTGVANDERAKKIAKKLAEEKDGLIPCTLSMLSFKYDALLKVSIGYGKYIISDINKKYKYMLDNDATSFWETLKGAEDFEGAGSLCHGWSALPIYYFNLLLKGEDNEQKN